MRIGSRVKKSNRQVKNQTIDTINIIRTEWIEHFMDESLLRELPLFDEKFEDVKLKRSTCAVCARPSTVCVCHAICEKLHISTKVIVLQHPAEQNRQLRTVPLLKAALEDDKCMIIVGKRFKNLDQLLSVPTALLFPGKDAVECSAVLPGTFKQLVCLDGTWPQARRLYQKNPILHSLPKVMLNSVRKSVYLIHTQPTLQHLSTLESVARAIEDMEKLDGLEEKMVAPLKEMVRTQFKYGACAHSTQEEARAIRKQEIKNGEKNLTVAPKLENFDYNSF